MSEKKLILRDISLYSTKELVKEILKRYDAAVFSGLRVFSEDRSAELHQNWAGQQDVCKKLADELSWELVSYRSHKNKVEKTHWDGE